MPGMIVTLSDKNGNQMMDLATGAEAIITTAADGSYWFTGLAPWEYGRPQPTQAQGSTSAILVSTTAPLATVVHGTSRPMARCRTPADVCAPPTASVCRPTPPTRQRLPSWHRPLARGSSPRSHLMVLNHPRRLC